MCNSLFRLYSSEMFIVVTSFLLAIVLVGVKVYTRMTVGQCKSRASLRGKTTIVSGANTGIGFWTALDFAKRNGRVILACRDLKKAKEAQQKIIATSGNKNVHIKHLDLRSLKSVREFAEEINNEEGYLHILVNNAGVSGLPRLMTDEGLERTCVVNYFGPFLLTNLLSDLMEKSSPARIVNVSSGAYAMGTIDLDNLNREKSYSVGSVYFDTKLGINLFTRELARRLEHTGVTVNCLHPGAVKTELTRSVPQWAQLLLYPFNALVAKTAEEGAQTSIYCAVSDEVEGVSGEYFVDCAPCSLSQRAMDEVVASKLWIVSEKITGLVK